MVFMRNLTICWMVASCIDCGTSEARRWGDLLWWCASKCLHGRDQHSSIVRRGSSLGLLHQDKTLVAYSILQLYTLLTAWNCHDHVCLLLVLNIFDVFVSYMCAHVSVHTILSHSFHWRPVLLLCMLERHQTMAPFACPRCGPRQYIGQTAQWLSL